VHEASKTRTMVSNAAAPASDSRMSGCAKSSASHICLTCSRHNAAWFSTHEHPQLNGSCRPAQQRHLVVELTDASRVSRKWTTLSMLSTCILQTRSRLMHQFLPLCASPSAGPCAASDRTATMARHWGVDDWPAMPARILDQPTVQ